MKPSILLNLLLLVTPFFISSESNLYGKIWITLESKETPKETNSDMESNKSRVGITGDFDLKTNLKMIYQLEYEIDPVDGISDEIKDKTFKQRNSFLGLKSSYGSIFLGTYDTAFKRSQNNIDLFNDLAGDIKNILQGENRMNDSIVYMSPISARGFSLVLNAIKRSEDLFQRNNSHSTSISFIHKSKNLQTSIAVDSEVKGYDSRRFSLQIPFPKTQIGFIYQDTKKLSTGISENGYILSLSRQFGDKVTLKFQTAKSDMKISSGKQNSFGFDYKLNRKTNIFFFYTDLLTKDDLKEKAITALGFEYDF